MWNIFENPTLLLMHKQLLNQYNPDIGTEYNEHSRLNVQTVQRVIDIFRTVASRGGVAKLDNHLQYFYLQCKSR